MAGLTQAADRFEPAEDLFPPFALKLTERVSSMARSALVNGAVLSACEMRGDPMVPHFLNQAFAVIAFFSTQPDPTPAWNLPYHRECRLSFGAPGSLSDAAVDRQPMWILHQHMAGVAELRFLALSLARQQRFRIGSGLVGIVAPLLPLKFTVGLP